jgi:hypothetical protein
MLAQESGEWSQSSELAKQLKPSDEEVASTLVAGLAVGARSNQRRVRKPKTGILLLMLSVPTFQLEATFHNFNRVFGWTRSPRRQWQMMAAHASPPSASQSPGLAESTRAASSGLDMPHST